VLLLGLLSQVVADAGSEIKTTSRMHLRVLDDDYTAPPVSNPNGDENNQDDGSGDDPIEACLPNLDKTGVECKRLVLQSSKFFGEDLIMHIDSLTLFDSLSGLFLSTGLLTMNLGNMSDVKIMDLVYNSSTPSGTLLSTGLSTFGPILVKTENALFPTLPVLFQITHEASLWRDPSQTACIPDGGPCDDGQIMGTFGLYASGSDVKPSSQVQVNMTEPDSAKFELPFLRRLSGTQYCQTEQYSVNFRKDMVAHMNVCIFGVPCFNEDQPFELSDQNQTALNDLCFEYVTPQSPSTSLCEGEGCGE